jgi:multidrug efflux pump subunit AcrB
MDTVLVVGGRTTGLMMAAELARRGVPVTHIDKFRWLAIPIDQVNRFAIMKSHPRATVIIFVAILTGALFAMYLTDTTLNIYTKIGLIMLVGLISKNGILIVDFSNKMLAQGMSVRAAVVRGSTTRLRPILMTAAAMIFGALPLVLSDGAGSIARNQIGWVIIGGMFLGTMLTLFVVPTAYLIVNRYLMSLRPERGHTH